MASSDKRASLLRFSKLTTMFCWSLSTKPSIFMNWRERPNVPVHCFQKHASLFCSSCKLWACVHPEKTLNQKSIHLMSRFWVKFWCHLYNIRVCPFIRLSVHLSICSSVHLSICPFVQLFIYPSVHLSICPFVCLFIGPSVHLSICPQLTAGTK
jgi:hypothetical protein